ncbi:hypothetical protein HPB50_009168 [Hyalomma asiaticum]|uniref:Uncharacterized protein n=1 Tax=Hyalomma asiaticum TaxID=266040 RepID=A0ACB7SWQ3_HYAAI|nr:hypothetical protein HPB50_009168 [Hyalomma asiaticum]
MEQTKMKSIIVDQAQEIAFLKGRISELEKQKAATPMIEKQDPPRRNSTLPPGSKKPTYAVVVSSNTLERHEVAALIKRRVDPVEIGAGDVSMRNGREGVVITTSSKEATAQFINKIQTDSSLTALRTKLPREKRLHIKITGITDEIDPLALTEKMVAQNHLPCALIVHHMDIPAPSARKPSAVSTADGRDTGKNNVRKSLTAEFVKRRADQSLESWILSLLQTKTRKPSRPPRVLAPERSHWQSSSHFSGGWVLSGLASG